MASIQQISPSNKFRKLNSPKTQRTREDCLSMWANNGVTPSTMTLKPNCLEKRKDDHQVPHRSPFHIPNNTMDMAMTESPKSVLEVISSLPGHRRYSSLEEHMAAIKDKSSHRRYSSLEEHTAAIKNSTTGAITSNEKERRRYSCACEREVSPSSTLSLFSEQSHPIKQETTSRRLSQQRKASKRASLRRLLMTQQHILAELDKQVEEEEEEEYDEEEDEEFSPPVKYIYIVHDQQHQNHGSRKRSMCTTSGDFINYDNTVHNDTASDPSWFYQEGLFDEAYNRPNPTMCLGQSNNIEDNHQTFDDAATISTETHMSEKGPHLLAFEPNDMQKLDEAQQVDFGDCFQDAFYY